MKSFVGIRVSRKFFLIAIMTLVSSSLLANLFEIMGWSNPVRIMALGDSITNGQYGTQSNGDGYRLQLYPLLSGNGDNFEFVGTLTSNGSSTLPVKKHEGHSGWCLATDVPYGYGPGTDVSMRDHIADYMNTTQPDVILTLLGTNDYYGDYYEDFSLDQFLARYGRLLDTMVKTNPNARIVCSSITARDVWWLTDRQLDFNKHFPQFIQQKFAEGKNVFYADLASVVNGATDLKDGVHFNVSGDTHAANAWYDALRSTLKSPAGFLGEYYDNVDFTSLKMSHFDNTINFDWTNQSPTPQSHMMAADNFSVQWSGYIAPAYTETYTFSAEVNGGVRLYVNNQLLIDQWSDNGARTLTGQLALTANQQYSIRMAYLKTSGNASAKLYWSSTSQAKQIVPPSATAISNHAFANFPVSTMVCPSKDTIIMVNSGSLLLKANVIEKGTGSISKVEFLKNGVVVGQGTAVSGVANQWQYSLPTPTNGKFFVSVRATDSYGYSSITAMADTVAVGTRQPEILSNPIGGIQYKYYETDNLSFLPDFTTLTPAKTGTASNFDLSTRNRNTDVAWIFYGHIKIPTDGIYTFSLTSNQASNLYIGNSLVVWNDFRHGAFRTRTGGIALKAGYHALRVEYSAWTEFTLQVGWSGPGVSGSIPSSALFYSTSATPVVETTLRKVSGGDVESVQIYATTGKLIGSFSGKDINAIVRSAHVTQGTYVFRVIGSGSMERVFTATVLTNGNLVYRQ